MSSELAPSSIGPSPPSCTIWISLLSELTFGVYRLRVLSGEIEGEGTELGEVGWDSGCMLVA